jgi:hypothetical protein
MRSPACLCCEGVRPNGVCPKGSAPQSAARWQRLPRVLRGSPGASPRHPRWAPPRGRSAIAPYNAPWAQSAETALRSPVLSPSPPAHPGSRSGPLRATAQPTVPQEGSKAWLIKGRASRDHLSRGKRGSSVWRCARTARGAHGAISQTRDGCLSPPGHATPGDGAGHVPRRVPAPGLLDVARVFGVHTGRRLQPLLRPRRLLVA